MAGTNFSDDPGDLNESFYKALPHEKVISE
jgi:hypothetical protein